MQEFISKFIYMNGGSIQAVLKFKIVRDNYKFKVVFELYELHIKNDQVEMCKLVQENCNQINSQVLEKFSNDLKGSIILDYYNVESYLPILKSQIIQLQDDTKYNITLYNKLQVILNKVELIRIYNDLESFYKNYLLLETCLKMITSDDNPPVEVVKVCNYKKENKVIPQINNQKEDSNLLFQLCVNTQLKQLLIHQILTYYLFLPLDKIQIIDNVITIPNLFSSILFNKKYSSSLIFSLNKIEVQDLKITILKILKNLKENNKLDAITIIGLSFLLYFYFLRLIYDTHTLYLLNNIEDIFKNKKTQEKILNSQINIYFKDIDIQFKVFDIDIENMAINVNIEELSKTYNYLKIVDQEDFIDTIFKKVSEKQKKLKINQYSLLDIDMLNKTVIDLNEISIFNNNNTIQGKNQLLLKYDIDKDNKINTYCLTLFNIFINDPNKFYLLTKNNDITLSVTVLHLFPKISKLLKNINKCEDKLDDTFTYYKLISNEIGQDFLPNTLLFIIYQLIIPYMYNTYNIKVFNDCLL